MFTMLNAPLTQFALQFSLAAVDWSNLFDHELDGAVTIFYEKSFDVVGRKYYLRNKSPNNKALLQQVENCYEAALSSTFQAYIDRMQQNLKRDPSS